MLMGMGPELREKPQRVPAARPRRRAHTNHLGEG